ncbi:glycoprotein-N-acetylgalactosamine 3-beta-galactosyltransferase 1-like isoform X2 [Bradysia coprophila]|uniref:glycoprotein-N-acetylgalactosamine 3-beta-galactosyltransferase 1-like isoform X2 n=1 Tax=Bradysia coprophila TaxID=38358 RepID=UPI00187DC9CD|nr:glycoprotein-N-acetylgalactosamine 3-beta-galactosyltransferase 1-like isoform X2 [Bradysia coprophila]
MPSYIYNIKQSLCRNSIILWVLVIVTYITFYLSCSPLKAADFRIGKNRSATEGRVLCWVMTNPTNHRMKAIHVQRTWGRRCNKLIFMSSEEDPELSSVVALNVEEGRDHLWAKTKEAFKYIYQHHLDEAEWFLKADDDTYVIVENLRFFLKDFDSNNAVSLGCKFTQGFFSGGAGYVLSKESVKRFVENSLLDGSKCRQEHDGLEDLEMGTCLYNIGIETTDTRDTIGRYRFLPFNPQIEVVPRNPSDKYWFYMYYPER